MPDGDQTQPTVGATPAPQPLHKAANYRLLGINIRKDGWGIETGDGGLIDNTLTTLAVPPNSAGAAVSNAFYPEDEYQKLYVGGVNSKGLLQPPYMPRILDRLTQENDALSPCIEAMVTNIDGTGYIFEKNTDSRLEQDPSDPVVLALNDFFDEPWPGENFMSIRKKVRRDIERTGNGYIEVIRTPSDEIVYMRHVDAKMMRIVKLDEPTVATKTVRRKGVEVKVKTQVRERRFCQLLNGMALVYFKEFGATRDLNKKNGMWAKQGERLPANLRASEMLHIIALPDAHTPYGVPRWVSQMPSVLGSRKAEEFNLDYFDNGGVPPLLILLQGGTLATETRRSLEQGLQAGAKRANRVQILEAEPVGGAIDSPSTAKITIERFGHDRQVDSMFEKYDDKCEQRVRRGFRLPPIFVGAAQDYSFASAYASYTVAEAQVFQPERSEFDEMLTLRVLPVMGYRGYRIRSLPMRINDTAKQMQAIELAGKTDHVDPKDIVAEVNEVMGLNMKISPTPVIGFGEAMASLTLTQPGVNTNPVPPLKPVTVGTSGTQSTPSAPPKSGAPGAAAKKADQVEPYRAKMIEITADAHGVYEDTLRDKISDNAEPVDA